MIPNYKEIFDAWVTSFNPTMEQKELAQKRLDICKSCEFKKETISGIKWSTVCGACGCPLSKKVFSSLFNPCPKQKWESVDSYYLTKLDNKNKNTII
jgi:hypothetical protein